MADVDVRHFKAQADLRRRSHDIVIVRAGKRRVEITISPAGKSVQVFVDGEKWEARRG